MSIGETMLRACIKNGVSMDALTEISEIAARADARIAELEQSVTVRDTEIARLETAAARYLWLRECDLEGDRAVHIGDELKSGAFLDAAIDAAMAVKGLI